MRPVTELYLANNMRLGVLLDVEAETVRGYDQQVSGEPVLPGFQLDFRPLRRS